MTNFILWRWDIADGSCFELKCKNQVAGYVAFWRSCDYFFFEADEDLLKKFFV